RHGREQVHGPGDDAGPAGLVAGPEAGPVVAVEVLVEQDEVPPVRVGLELLGAAVDRAATVVVPQEDARRSTADLLGDLLEVHSPSGPGGAFDGEGVTVV